MAATRASATPTAAVLAGGNGLAGLLDVLRNDGSDAAAPDWQQAKCRAPGVDTEWFFPPTTRTDNELYQRLAARGKAVCADCPIRQQCGEWAAATGQYGVWGGQDDADRAAARRGARAGEVAA